MSDYEMKILECFVKLWMLGTIIVAVVLAILWACGVDTGTRR